MNIIPKNYFAVRQFIQIAASTCTKQQKRYCVDITRKAFSDGLSAAKAVSFVSEALRGFKKKSNEAA